MDGVIAAIVAFFFVCIVFPKLVKNHAQFYIAFGMILLMILLGTLGMMFGDWAGLHRFIAVMDGLLTLCAMVMLVLATGGLSIKDLGGEFKNAFEVIRRGESEKEIIVPLTGEVPKPRKPRTESEVETATLPIAPAAVDKKPEDKSSIPLE